MNHNQTDAAIIYSFEKAEKETVKYSSFKVFLTFHVVVFH